MIKNQKGILIVFFPIVIFCLLFIAVDHINKAEQAEYEEAYEYFKGLYSNRLIVLAVIILVWNYAKRVVSGYVLLFITYVFNILIVFSDIFNIYQFINKYEDLPHRVFYMSLFLKLYVNFFFFVSWMILLGYNMHKWYQLYQMSQRIEVEQKEEVEEIEEVEEEHRENAEQLKEHCKSD